MAKSKCRPIPAMTASDRPRLFSKIEQRGPDECWPWTASLSGSGYGQFSFKRLGQNFPAHRIVYFLEYGVDPGPLFVCHTCDNHLCCNPKHLFLGSQTENMQDAKAKGHVAAGDDHASRKHPEMVPRGESKGKLKETDIIEIRALWASGTMSQSAIGRKFGVQQTNIWCIVNRKTWAHIA